MYKELLNDINKNINDLSNNNDIEYFAEVFVSQNNIEDKEQRREIKNTYLNEARNYQFNLIK